MQTRAPGYLLQIEPGELDLARFERLHREGCLDEALSLWRGSPLAEFAGERFAQPHIARLEELHLSCLESESSASSAAAATPSSSPSSRRSRGSTRSASGCGLS